MVTWPILGFYTPLNISGTAKARVVKFCVPVVLAFGQLIDHERGVARVSDYFLEFYTPQNIFRMVGPRLRERKSYISELYLQAILNS